MSNGSSMSQGSLPSYASVLVHSTRVTTGVLREVGSGEGLFRDIGLEAHPRRIVWSMTYRPVHFVLQYLLDEHHYFRRQVALRALGLLDAGADSGDFCSLLLGIFFRD